MDYRRRRTDVVRLRLFMCFKGGSFIPRVHAPVIRTQQPASTPLSQNSSWLALRLREQASQ